MMCVYAGFSTIENGLRLQQENLCYPHGSISCSCELLKWVIKRLDLHQFFKRFTYLFFKRFIYFWLRWVIIAARGISLKCCSWGYSWLRCPGFSLQWLLFLGSTGSRLGPQQLQYKDSESCFKGSWALAQLLWHRGLVVPRHLGSSKTRDWTHFPCIGRLIRNHWITREALAL